MNPETQLVAAVVKKGLNLKAILLPVVLGVLLIVASGLGIHQCSRKQFWNGRTDKLVADSIRNGQDRVRWRGDSLGQVSIILSQKSQIEKATRLAADWETKFYGQVAISDQQVDRLSYQAKQVALMRELVNNKTLSPIYLRDTLRIAVSDTAILTATTKTVKRANLAMSQVDSMKTVVAIQQTALEKSDARLHRARESSLYAQEKLQKLAEPRPWFSKSRRKEASEAVPEVRKKRESEESELERALNY
ncbi:hypothetical protein [Spirosoma pomorum]